MMSRSAPERSPSPNTVGSRMSVLASWGVIIALLAQESVSGLGMGASSWSGRVVLGKVVAIGTSLLYVALQLRIVRGASGSSTRRLVLVLIVGAGAALLVDGQWAPLPLALSAVMLVLPPFRAVVAVGVIMVALTVYVALEDPRLVVVMPPGVLAFGAVLYAFVRLSVVIRELQLAREELARTRVDQERQRMQRDLHDLLGRTLVAASLRNQIALRTLDVDLETTREHLAHLHAVLTEGQARLRALTSGPVIVSLADEIESASTLCRRLGIEISLEVDPLLDGAPDREVGAVVRESVTNLLKHSSARHCSITIHAEPTVVVVTVVNDGCLAGDRDAQEAREVRSDGTGLRSLRELAVGLGGSLSAEFVEDRRFRISARLPWSPPLEPGPDRCGVVHSQEQR